MSSTSKNDGTGSDAEKPVHDALVVFPPFPDPTDEDFEDNISEEEKNYYKEKFPDVNSVVKERLHCSACDRHLGCAAKNDSRMRCHPMLRTLMCHTCYSFYNSGEFEKGDDGSELYCRWCGQGGQVYCCSDCPVVFCAKCVKRNFGVSKIKHIEATDDWKCFKCDTKCLWDLRAVCWALLRYCDLKNKITACTVDVQLKSLYEKDCSKDFTECCRNKYKRKEKTDSKIKKEEKKDAEEPKSQPVSSIITKIPPTIQVKKFAHINMSIENSPKEKKPTKRPASPRNKNMVTIRPGTMPHLSPIPSKKIRMPTISVINPIRVQNTRPVKPNNVMPTLFIGNNQFNGYSNPNPYSNNIMMNNDNINLSLESLTQGLNMSAVSQTLCESGMDTSNDVVCTPDFPLEPLCEVTEDNTDDDVECITPTPIPGSKRSAILPKVANKLPDSTADNIIQMTDHDVTINAATGGLKFRVDPQTLSSNKMYRLPDGRVFAINVNPNMPGGYSATIVAVTENKSGKVPPKGSTFSAKLSSVNLSSSSTKPNILKTYPKKSNPKKNKSPKLASQRECNLTVPVEWFRYNLIDAVDSLEYSLKRLQTLKKEANSMFLRSRTLSEMRDLHKHFDRLLNTSSTRFNEIREQLNKEMKKYVSKKTDSIVSDDDDDDDVEILNDMNDDPIFIDENSVDSADKNDNEDIDLTGHDVSDPNDSGEKTVNQNDLTNISSYSLNCTEQIDKSEGEQSPKKKITENSNNVDFEKCSGKDKPIEGDVNDENSVTLQKKKEANAKDQSNLMDENNDKNSDENHVEVQGAGLNHTEDDANAEDDIAEERIDDEILDDGDDEQEVKKELLCEPLLDDKDTENEQYKEHDNADKEQDKEQDDADKDAEKVKDNKQDKAQDDAWVDKNVDTNDDKSQDTEMTEDMIENLLKDATESELDDTPTVNCMDIPDFQVP